MQQADPPGRLANILQYTLHGYTDRRVSYMKNTSDLLGNNS